MIGNRPRNRRRSEERGWQWPTVDWRRAVQGVVGLAAIALLALLLQQALDRPVTTVAVEGRFQRVSPLEVEQAVRERLQGAGLVSADLDAVRRSLEALPWVDRASVARAWPTGLKVDLSEQVAAARWGANGLLNSRGELFISEARFVPVELPRLSGPLGSEGVVAQRYLTIQGRLAEGGVRLAALRLDARGAWEIDLDNGVSVRLGRRDIEARFERFAAAALQLVAQRGAEIAYVDMRYSNGFATGWRNGTRVAAMDDDDETPEG
jgi:cell division protein FtsQ